MLIKKVKKNWYILEDGASSVHVDILDIYIFEICLKHDKIKSNYNVTLKFMKNIEPQNIEGHGSMSITKFSSFF